MTISGNGSRALAYTIRAHSHGTLWVWVGLMAVALAARMSKLTGAGVRLCVVQVLHDIFDLCHRSIPKQSQCRYASVAILVVLTS